MDGAPGLHVDAHSAAWAARGSLDELELAGFSKCHLTQLSPTTTVEPGSNLVQYTGVMPDLDAEGAHTLGVPFDIQIETAPGQSWQMGVSPSPLPIDLNNPDTFQRPFLLDLLSNFMFASAGVSDPGTGLDTQAVTTPTKTPFLGVPLVVQIWTIEVVPAIEFRFSNAVTIFGMP